MLSDANIKAADANRFPGDAHVRFYGVPKIPCIVSDFPKPKLLHTLQIIMRDHLGK